MMKLTPVVWALLCVPAVAHAGPVKPSTFAPCAACHKTESGAKGGIGPNLWGVGGRVSGTLAGFAYSPAMRKAKVKWTKATIVKFITYPSGAVPGTFMTYPGQRNPAAAAAIADYILSLK